MIGKPTEKSQMAWMSKQINKIEDILLQDVFYAFILTSIMLSEWFMVFHSIPVNAL